jgi:hypothetical protein
VTITSSHGRSLLSSIRKTLELVAEHAKTQPHEAAMILDALAAHLRSAAPMAMIDPIGELRVTVNGDGAAYHLTSSERLFGVRLYDVTGDDALVLFEPKQGARFITDAQRVLAAVGG